MTYLSESRWDSESLGEARGLESASKARWDSEILLVYGLSNLDSLKSKKTFPYLMEALSSNRYPYTIMLIGANVGMYIPPRKRYGLEAFHFFLQNLRYYDDVLDRKNSNEVRVLDLIQLSQVHDRVKYLMKFRDDEILTKGYIFSRNYQNRREMLQDFIKNNLLIHGEFRLTNTSRSVYENKVPIILYQEGTEKILYTTEDLLQLVDLRKKVLWKNSTMDCPLSKLALISLRHQILEKFHQWKTPAYPSKLYALVSHLEILLETEKKEHLSAYLGTPSLE